MNATAVTVIEINTEEIELVAGCFSSKPRTSRLSGKDFFLDPSRVYTSYEDMAKKEAALPAESA